MSQLITAVITIIIIPLFLSLFSYASFIPIFPFFFILRDAICQQLKTEAEERKDLMVHLHLRVCSQIPLPLLFPFHAASISLPWPPSSLSRQERGECGGAPCRVVYDKAFLQKADAVVIRPTVHRLPRARTPSQLWILFSVEAPTR